MLPPLRPAVAGYRAPLPRACVPDRAAGRGQRILLSRHGTGTASRRERPALPAASSTLAWTENSPARRVIATTRSTRCCGAASSRSPPACRACLRPRASAATPLQSMNFRLAGSNDDPRVAGNGRRERGRHIRGIYQVKLPAQRDDNMAVAFAGTQIHAEQRELPASAARRGPDPAANSRSSMNSTPNTRPCRVRADTEFTAVPLRSAIRPRLPSTAGCGNPPQPRSPGHAHWLPDSMPARR